MNSAEIQRDLTEILLCEKFGWTPEQIAKIPYKWIQKYFIIDNARNAGLDMKQQKNKFKEEQLRQGRIRGPTKFYREL